MTISPGQFSLQAMKSILLTSVALEQNSWGKVIHVMAWICWWLHHLLGRGLMFWTHNWDKDFQSERGKEVDWALLSWKLLLTYRSSKKWNKAAVKEGEERLRYYIPELWLLCAGTFFNMLHSAFRRMQRCDETDAADAGNIALLAGQTFGGNSVY